MLAPLDPSRAAPQRRDLARLKIPPLAGAQSRVAQRADRGADQPLHGVAGAFEYLAHLVRLPLADDDAPPGVHALGRGAHQRQLHRRDARAGDHGPPCESFARRRVGHTSHLCLVFTQHAIARMCDVQRELAIVRQQHEPFRMVVEAADREEPLALSRRDELDDGRAALGVPGRGHDLDRLVDEHVARCGDGSEPLPVDLDRVHRRVGGLPEDGLPAVDGHPPVVDERLGVAARAHAGSGDHLL
jgi:hypothetical protein